MNIGIDIGSASTVAMASGRSRAAGHYLEAYDATLLEGSEFRHAVPSLATIEPYGAPRVGQNALRAYLQGEAVIRFWQKDFGVEAERAFLNHMFQHVARSTGCAPAKTVFTIPAYLLRDRMERLQESAEAAGFGHRDACRLLPTPIAAALAGWRDASSRNGVYLICDLGATLDVSILEANDGSFDIVWLAGDRAVGGPLFSDRMYSIIRGLIHCEYPQFLLNDDSKQDRAIKACLQKLAECLAYAILTEDVDMPFEAVEKVGRDVLDSMGKLFERDEQPGRGATMDAVDAALSAMSNRREGYGNLRERLLENDIHLIIHHCNNCMTRSGVEPQGLNGILLAGRFAKIKELAWLMQERFMTALTRTPHPEFLVAAGAAICASQ